MKVELFCLCDFAQATDHGKLNILGVFDSIYAVSTPAAHDLCAAVAKVTLDKIELGEKKIKISFLDPQKNPILTPVEASLPVQTTVDAKKATLQAVALFPQLRLPSFGEYAVVLEIDGQEAASIPLYLRQAPTTTHPKTSSPA